MGAVPWFQAERLKRAFVTFYLWSLCIDFSVTLSHVGSEHLTDTNASSISALQYSKGSFIFLMGSWRHLKAVWHKRTLWQSWGKNLRCLNPTPVPWAKDYLSSLKRGLWKTIIKPDVLINIWEAIANATVKKRNGSLIDMFICLKTYLLQF